MSLGNDVDIASTKVEMNGATSYDYSFTVWKLVTLIRTALVDLVANFVADVLEHPRVQAAAASSIVAGMNATADQPDLPERAATIYLKLQEQNEHVSRQLGEQFPKVAGAFLAGVAKAGLGKKEPNKNEQLKDNESNKPGSHNNNNTLGTPWGSLFRSLNNAEEKRTQVETEVNNDSANNAGFPLLSIGSFHSCPDYPEHDDKHEAIKDKRS